ncbi:STAS domain-containing protein [Candidatus Margulisiibacteriota bacterium]
MELIKTILESNIIKIEIGADYNEEKKILRGMVELDIENQACFVDMIESIFKEGKYNRIIVDMHNVNYIDSSGLWALFESHKKAEQKKGKLILLNPTKDVKRVLDITKMSSKIKLYTDEPEAMKDLSIDSESA